MVETPQEEDFEEFESAEEMFKKFHEEDLKWEKEHPVRGYIRRWLDKHIPKGIADKRAYYALQKPLEILRYWKDHIEYARQRVSRGWDDRAAWSVEYYLAETLPSIIRQLKEKGHGVPVHMFEGWEKFPL